MAGFKSAIDALLGTERVAKAMLWWPEAPAKPDTRSGIESFGSGTKEPAPVLEFPINPSQLKLSRNPEWERKAVRGQSQAQISFKGAQADSLSFKFVLDESELRPTGAAATAAAQLPPFLGTVGSVAAAAAGSDLLTNTTSVTDAVLGLYSLTRTMVVNATEPLAWTTKAPGYTGELRPPVVVFIWEALVFAGVIDKLDVDLILFDATGAAKRAEINITLSGRVVEGGLSSLSGARISDLLRPTENPKKVRKAGASVAKPPTTKEFDA
jgi:Contractile injection system tube protein